MAAIRIALDSDDREVLAGFGILDRDWLGDKIREADGLSGLWDALAYLRRILRLHEVAEWGEALVDEHDVPALIDLLWKEGQGAHEGARDEGERILVMRGDPAHIYEGCALEDSEE